MVLLHSYVKLPEGNNLEDKVDRVGCPFQHAEIIDSRQHAALNSYIYQRCRSTRSIQDIVTTRSQPHLGHAEHYHRTPKMDLENKFNKLANFLGWLRFHFLMQTTKNFTSLQLAIRFAMNSPTSPKNIHEHPRSNQYAPISSNFQIPSGNLT
jgi:hypothetical protein